MTTSAVRKSCRIIVGLVIFIGAITVGAQSSPVSAEEVIPASRTSSFIAEVIRAYGGEKNISRITTIFTKGSVHTLMQDKKGVSTRYFKRPRKLRAELFYPHATETRIVNGAQGWRGSDTTPLREILGPPYLAMVYQFKYLDLPFGFLDKGYTITRLGRETLQGLPMEVLQLVDDEGPTMRVYIDAATHLIARVTGRFNFGQATTELSADFSDYRDVEGIKVPFKVINYSGGNRIAETAVTEVRINMEMPDSLFRP